MELRQIKYFVKVAEVLNFCEAARQLNISQSTVSQQIQQLENELGASLLTRDSHHVSLTDVGKAFLPQAVRTLKAAASCLDRIRDIQMLDSGELNIGSTYSFLPLLKETVLMFMKQYPGVKINIMCHSMETLLKMLNEERIDVALSYKPNFVQPGIDSHIMFDNKLAIIVSDTHPLARHEKVRLVDIEKYPFAMPAKGLQARNTFDLLTKDIQADAFSVTGVCSLVWVHSPEGRRHEIIVRRTGCNTDVANKTGSVGGLSYLSPEHAGVAGAIEYTDLIIRGPVDGFLVRLESCLGL